jgi:enoyl-CoA hydratase/carnithine racemase
MDARLAGALSTTFDRKIAAEQGDLMDGRILVEIKAGIAEVRLARAAKKNALDESMFVELVETGKRLAQEPHLRAVVLSGEGAVFCAGIDLHLLERIGVAAGLAPLAERAHGLTNSYQQAVWTWRELPVPVIAAVQGVAFGGGFQLALGADLRIAAPDARFSIMETDWGLVPDMAGTLLMRNLARDDVIRELTYTARIFSADQALSYGFVTQVCEDPHARATSIAEQIARRRPDAIRAAKRLLNKAAENAATADMLLGESEAQQSLLAGPNHREAINANLERRPPRFSD